MTSHVGARRAWLVPAATFVLIALVSTLASAGVLITEFPVPPSSGGPGPITAAPSGIWFAEPNDDAIGRFIPKTGDVTIYPTPFPEPRGITTGPNGAVWFTQTGSGGPGGIGRITPDGTITVFTSPELPQPFAIAPGPDGNIWFTQLVPEKIGRITPSGTIELFPFSPGPRPVAIVTGPDGNVWVAESGIVNGGIGGIGVVTPSGTLTEYPLPTPAGFASGAEDITVGPDGNLWFTWVEWDAFFVGPPAANIGMITPSGTITKFPVSADFGWPPMHITAGPDGNLWFTQGGADLVGSISATGAIVTYPVPSTGSFPNDITMANRALWFTEPGTSEIARLRIKP